MKTIESGKRPADSPNDGAATSLSLVLAECGSLALQQIRRPVLRINRRYMRTATQRAAEFQRRLYADAASQRTGSKFNEPWTRGGLNE